MSVSVFSDEVILDGLQVASGWQLESEVNHVADDFINRPG